MSSTTSTILFTLTILLSLILPFLVVAQSPFASWMTEPDEEDQFYVLDNPSLQPANLRSRSRFLLSVIKKGTSCNAVTKNICNGVQANNGTSLLYCCKKHCRNILGDRNNCGRCGQKCSFGELCCNGVCTSVAYNPYNCGKCNKKCAAGVSCNYGVCGYA
ncbi:protein GRIM REAPER [Punica granatum]|uniref:Protein GRIM REAPER n=1 Tax=Punica granatum TaxID=22663 RepID=A0A218XWK2_PUNGR|nr:protein GRIM REAPER [Punica granatum]OWM88652.1 hypothetical protein CDL15_Pgr002419 [Punica granatum]